MYPGIIASRAPDRIAVVMAGSGQTITHRELDERSNALAHLLRGAGLRHGDHVTLFMENQLRFLEIVWAALRSGLYLTAINSHLTAEEVAYIVGDCDAQAFITSTALAGVAGEVPWADLPRVHTKLMVDGTIDGFASYEDAVATQPTTPIDDERTGATMLYSSGTTGRPKGVLRPLPDTKPGDGEDRLAALSGPYKFRDGMVYLSPAPMYHAAPLAFSINTHRFGGTVVIMEKFDPAAALRAIETHKVTHSQWVPTMFVRLLRLSDAERLGPDLSSHECAIHAAAPCPVAVKQQMIEWWGPIIHEYYAGTEGNGSTGINSEEWLAHPGSVGRPRGATVHIIDDEGNEVGPGQEGTIYFASPTGQFEYHNDPEKTAGSRLTVGDKQLTTLGDVGYLDEEGYLYLTDRKAYMIISGGVNIYPREIEDVLIQHPAVADVAVFGIPNEEMGEEVKAVVQLLPGNEPDDATRTELLQFTRSHLAGYKCPRTLDFIDELPRLPTGKLYKRVLRDPYWADKKPAATS
jgi:acyl-CoA synthetase (AMP-forming)/AMP-acid ligase II